MLVRHWMTPAPHTTSPDAPLTSAVALMKERRVRRLPVLDEERLVGILSRSDLERVMSPAELAGLTSTKGASPWRRRLVREVMTARPHTTHPNAAMERAANLMLEHHVSCLPVLNKTTLTGIITESDLFRAFVQLTHPKDRGSRVCFQIPHKDAASIHKDILALCDEHDARLITLLTHPLPHCEDELVTMRVTGQRVRRVIDAIWKLNYRVLQVT